MKVEEDNIHVKKRKNKNSAYTKILKSAVDLFSKNWYETVSVSQICSNADVSNGTFYIYFHNKEELFKKLLQNFIEIVEEEFKYLKVVDIEDGLEEFLNTIHKIKKEYSKLITIFREGQYRFPEFDRKINDIYKKSAEKIYKRELTLSEYIYFISGIRFLLIRSLYQNMPSDKEIVKKIIMNGFFEENLKIRSNLFKENFIIPFEINLENTRERLIQSGIELFGKYGFFNTDIHDVAKNAGFSVGTFYIHFNSKTEFLSEIVRLIGKRTRWFISYNLDNGLNRAEKELQGLYLFLKFFENHSEYYYILREAEFIVNDVAQEYYDKYEEGYSKDLKEIKYPEIKIISNMLIGLSHYSGIEYIILKRIENLENYLLELAPLLLNGLK
ncbi:TetR/AcrR family transcriptional regulator [Petrotoga sp. 9PWA.NaAc.5.4]|uniref:TetR/AcrR family transcriptional regulator n=1 Tax=Petrotoga sp. 9PWA.NaAc.5.4 TaxID=1434328 RepID=UPI000CB6387C|nr:TetR/AcrR family transcriptional regulator [Petrotoga sp. 9PWA.NaAc.5.4]PNR92575.1 hypothetical protein X924_09655 [Petrotoga sp. 9PWA.NaAc.5.4]